ncbi:MAG: MFS transporter [Burkholderiaceae bacterium]|nr:MFS transporter [Burkholderiaceae bacterium]
MANEFSDHPDDTRHRITAILIASSGNLVEWFDFYVYSACSLYFAAEFFPHGDQTTQFMNTAGVFAAGFFMRPVGGWLFGRIADKRGRRAAMIISMIMMSGGSLMIACLPTYATLGVAAPGLLLLARMFQGLSVGGEYGTSATYMSEAAVKGKRGFYASFQYVTLIGGQLLAALVMLILTQILAKNQITAWGWRIPFVIGAMGALVAMYLRRSLRETSTADTRGNSQAGTFAGLWKHWRAFMTVIGFTAAGSLTFYTFTTYMPKYLVNTAHMEKETASLVATITLFVYMIMQPLFGALSDKIGRRVSMLCFSTLTMLGTVPIMVALKDANDVTTASVIIIVALACVSFYTSISGLIKAEMFPAEVRALGVGLSYAVANALFGGTAEYVALWFKDQKMESNFYWYVSFMCAIALVVSFRMRDSKKEGFLRDD